MAYRALNVIIMAALFAIASTGCGPATPTSETTAETEAESGDDPTPRDYYDHYMKLGGMAIAEGRTEDALNLYLEAADVLKKTGKPTVKEADARYEAAAVAYQRLEKQMAIDEYQKAVDIYLRFKGNSRAKAVVALTNMGAIHKETAQKDKARDAWETALQVYKSLKPKHQKKAHKAKIQQNIRDIDHGF